MTGGLVELSLVVVLATALGVLAYLMRQPIVLAYLLTGVAAGYFNFFNLANSGIFRLFSNLGIMFLLFLIGLEVNYASLKYAGKTSLIVGVGHFIITFVLGAAIALLFNFNLLQSAYIAVALTFSSTVIVVKLLSEKRDLNSLYGRVSIGFLLVQDVIAVLILVVLSGMENGSGYVTQRMISVLFEAIGLFAIMIWLGKSILPKLFDLVARSQELLFLAALAWVFTVAAIVSQLGFSVEIGGLLAGLSLANSSEHFQISSRIRPLRDFFILVFFALLGSSIALSNFGGLTFPIIVFSGFVLLGNPLAVMAIMGLLGYRKRTSFMAGVTVAQISEFSLVLAAEGLKLGHLTGTEVALITAVGINTIIISNYLILNSERIFTALSPYLSFIERRNRRDEAMLKKEFNKPIVLVGAHRTGQSILSEISRKDVLVVDFDPEAVHHLKNGGYDYLYGDIADEEIFERANVKNAEIVVSTNPQFEENLALVTELVKLRNSGNKKLKIIVRARTEMETELLYRAGADYVLLPLFTSGHYLGKMLAEKGAGALEKMRKKDISEIRREATTAAHYA